MFVGKGVGGKVRSEVKVTWIPMDYRLFCKVRFDGVEGSRKGGGI